MTPFRVAIDARMIHASGIGTYLQGLLEGIQTQDRSDFSFTLLGDLKRLPTGPWSMRAARSKIYSLTEQLEIPWTACGGKTALIHTPHYNMSCLLASRTVVTVHDVIHLKFLQYWPSVAARAYARFFFSRVIPKARAILTVSENTKRDLVEMLSIPAERIIVTYPAISHARFQNPDPALMPEFNALNLPHPYLLYVGNLKQFKNVERLVDVHQRLWASKKAPSLVLVGRNFIPGFDRKLSQAQGIRWLGEVRPALLPWLYKQALAFLFPSLYEGFGLPPLEAMASGTPVLCSNRGSLLEVVGDAALMIDPENIEEMAAGLTRLVDDDTLRKDLAAKGLMQAQRFSWNKMAEQTLRVYRDCLS